MIRFPILFYLRETLGYDTSTEVQQPAGTNAFWRRYYTGYIYYFPLKTFGGHLEVRP